MPIDITKRIDVQTFADNYVITAADVAAGNKTFIYKFSECLLTNFVMNNQARSSLFDLVLVSPGGSQSASITLIQLESSKGATYDIIWEGERYIPPYWSVRVIVQQNIVAGDQIQIHGGYDICAQL